jgi:hypothetical protein
MRETRGSDGVKDDGCALERHSEQGRPGDTNGGQKGCGMRRSCQTAVITEAKWKKHSEHGHATRIKLGLHTYSAAAAIPPRAKNCRRESGGPSSDDSSEFPTQASLEPYFPPLEHLFTAFRGAYVLAGEHRQRNTLESKGHKRAREKKV